MYMTIEVHQAVEEGKEREALEILKELNSRGLDYIGSPSVSRGLVVQAAAPPGLESGDGYRDHLGRVFSQIRRVTGSQARIRVRLTT